jgi:hypothetical protein
VEKHPSDLSPGAMPFDSYMRELPSDTAVPLEPACVAHECIAVAKRILLQERVRDFSAADVVALAAIIENRDREMKFFAASQK